MYIKSIGCVILVVAIRIKTLFPMHDSTYSCVKVDTAIVIVNDKSLINSLNTPKKNWQKSIQKDIRAHTHLNLDKYVVDFQHGHNTQIPIVIGTKWIVIDYYIRKQFKVNDMRNFPSNQIIESCVWSVCDKEHIPDRPWNETHNMNFMPKYFQQNNKMPFSYCYCENNFSI